MSDFNDDWQLTGSSDPATPDIQPHQLTQQAAEQPVFAQPMQNAQPQMPVQPAAPAPMPQQPQPVQAQPVYPQPFAQPTQPFQGQPVYQQPAYQQPVYQQPGFQQPVYQQPVYTQPAYQQPGFQQPGVVQPGIPGYGYPAQPVAYQNNVDFAAEREKNLNEIARMINHFSPKVDLYQDYEKCKTDIVRYSRASVAPLVWGIIIDLIGLILVYTAITANYKDNIIGYSIAAAVTLLIGSGMIALFIFKKKHGKKKVEELYKKLNELSNELNILYNGFSNCILPAEYSDPRILLKIQSLISSGRCLTIGNALNLLLSVPNTYARIGAAKAQFEKDTAARFDGKPAFFNAVRYINIR